MTNNQKAVNELPLRAVFHRVTPLMSLLTSLLLLGTSSTAIAQPLFFSFEEEETGHALAFMELSNIPVDAADDIRRIRFVDPMDPAYSLDIDLGGSSFGGVIGSDDANGLDGPASLGIDFLYSNGPSWLQGGASFAFDFDDGEGADRIYIPLPPISVDGNWIGVADNPFVCTPTNEFQGDLDGDGRVAFLDFLLLSANFGNNVENYGDGDVTCNGTVDFDDFLALSANFGKSLAAPGQLEVQRAAFVPEPSAATCAFIALACLAVISRRRNLLVEGMAQTRGSGPSGFVGGNTSLIE